MLLRLVSFFIVLGLLIFIHELGHYLAARLSKVKVEEFGWGYPPRLAKLFSFQGTDFTLNWIPFGGFARLKGTDEDNADPDSFMAAAPWRKLLILGAGSGMNLLLAILCFSVTYRVGVPVSTGLPELTLVPASSPAAAHGLQSGDILLALHGRPASVTPFASRVRIQAPADAEAPAGATGDLVLIRDGAVLRRPVAERTSVEALLAETQFRVVLSTRITGVAADSPAAQAGLQAGDRVYALGGQPLSDQLEDLIDAINRHRDREVIMVLLRDETEWVSAPVTPRASPPPGQGALGVTIGYASAIGFVRAPYYLAFGLADTLGYFGALLGLPAQIIRGETEPDAGGLVGPVGIANLVGDAVEVTTRTGLWLPVLRLTGALSAALAVINLMPIPALDGGRMLFALLEMVRRKRLDPTREKVVHMVGMALLLLLMVFITFQDLTAPQQGIDWYEILGQ